MTTIESFIHLLLLMIANQLDKKTPKKDDVLQIIINFNVGLSNESTHKILNVIQYYTLLCVFKISCLGIALTINDMFKTFIM